MIQYWNTDRIMRLIIGVTLTMSLLWLMYYLRGALLPFFVAILIAYFMQPLVSLNQRVLHTKKRVVPSVISLIEVTGVIALILWLTIPSVTSELGELSQIIDNVQKGRIEPSREMRYIIDFVDRHLNPRQLTYMLSHFQPEELIRKGSSLLEQSFNVVLETLEWMLTIIYVLFILIDYERIVRGLKMIVPLRYRKRTMVVIDDVKNGMNRYFRGQGVVALFAMVFYCAGFAIVGLPLAVPMGMLVGFLYMIPYFQYITVIPVAVIAFIYSLSGEASFWPLMGKCALVYVISQCVCDYIVTPRIMGHELGLHPAIIFLSLSVFGSLFGILGMIIALPATALIFDYYTRYISNR